MFSLREGAAAPHKLLSCLTGLLTRCTVKLTSPLIHRLSSAEWVPADFPTAGAFVAYRNVVSLLPPSAQPVVVPMQASAWLCDQGTKNLAPLHKTWVRKTL